jgi:uncharacterized protein YukJ
MPLQHGYGVLKARAVEGHREGGESTPHYQVHVGADGTDYRLAVNVRSSVKPPDLLYLVNDRFQHPVTALLAGLPDGFTRLASKPGEVALDFIRANLFDRREMRALPANAPGPDNDLSDLVDHYVQRAITEPDAEVYAFGERWGPENNLPDKVYQFSPGNGVHQIHMNQGNDPKHRAEDGVWQDGALLLHFPGAQQWVAIFLAFQSQTWHTDDHTGHALAGVPAPGPGPQPSPGEPDFRVRIVAALVNPLGPAPEHETVTLLNATADPMDLSGWYLADRLKNKQRLQGTVPAGRVLVVAVQPPVALGNQGGIITLLDAQGLKVDGVSYTAAQARREGVTIVF